MKKTLLFSAIAMALAGCSGDTDHSVGNMRGTATLNGNPVVGVTMSVTIDDSDGYQIGTETYSWTADDQVLSGVTGSEYTLTEAELGKTIRVGVQYTDRGNTFEDIQTQRTAEIVANEAGVVTITLTPVDDSFDVPIVGDTVTASVTDIAGTETSEFMYQWLADDVAIDNAVEQSYIIDTADVDKVLTVQVDYTDDAGVEETIVSDATDPVEDGSDTGPNIDNNVVEFSDTSTSQGGQLRYKMSSSDMITNGKLTVRFNKEDVMDTDGNAKDAYITLYGTSTSNSNALLDLRIQSEAFIIRDSETAVPDTFTFRTWNDVEVVWDTSAREVTLTINDGTPITYTPTPANGSTAWDTLSGGVQTVQFKVGDSGSTIPTGSYYIDDFYLYSDAAGTAVQFSDDYESYDRNYSLSDADGYNASTYEAEVIQQKYE
ncbi:hypothetical protein K0504_11920 [Neiella marina]|uniref:Uncharacterized protein n=1 Tax=Neiella holothuriorum TaxID=2870530 RepID=A0ABS7EHC3_9GAMM|nr:hypothetical protein [Neiella holothuriorum]MBW8191743.1 hypothetical protein [Neiella holothuriorum]